MFRANVVLLVCGTAIGQGLILVAAPLLTRLYSPEAFGNLAVFVALLGIITVVASLRYELSIPLPDNDDSAACLMILSLLLVFLNALLTFVIIQLFGERIAIGFNAPQLTSCLWLLPFAVMGAAIFKVLNFWAIRRKYFRHIALAKINQGIGIISIQIVIGLTVAGAIGLLLGQAIGQFFGIIILSMQILSHDKEAVRSINFTKVLGMMKQYRRFPLYSAWSAIFNTVSAYSPVLMLSFFFGPTVTGLYALGLRVVQTPVNLVGQAVSQVFFSTAAEKHREGTLSEEAIAVFAHLVQIALPITLLLGLAAPEIFTVVFGREWRVAGEYAQWIAPWMFFSFVSVPLSLVPSVLGKQRQEMFFNISLLFCRVIVLYVSGTLREPGYAVASFSVISSVFYCFFMFWILSVTGNSITNVLMIIMKKFVLIAPISFPVVAIKLYSPMDHYDLYVFLVTLFCLFILAGYVVRQISISRSFSLGNIINRLFTRERF